MLAQVSQKKEGAARTVQYRALFMVPQWTVLELEGAARA
jgi:hypothetical protein